MQTDPITAKVFTLSVLTFAGLLQLATAAGPSAKPVKIYVLSGQSNMTGRATLGDLKKPPTDQKATLVRYIMEPVIAVTGFGGNKHGIHWHANGESYWLVGEAMGCSMLGLLPAKLSKP